MGTTKETTGKFYIETTIRESFDTAEEREHYIKEHMECSFDTKVELLKKGKFVDDNADGDTLTVTLGEEK